MTSNQAGYCLNLTRAKYLGEKQTGRLQESIRLLTHREHARQEPTSTLVLRFLKLLLFLDLLPDHLPAGKQPVEMKVKVNMDYVYCQAQA